MRTLTIALATWREAIRQPVSIMILGIAAAVTFVSQFLTLYHFDEQTTFNVIRQMSVAQTLICGIVIAVFTASAVLAEDIENRTVLTLLAKPVRRHEIVLGKFVGIMMAIAGAFAVMMVVSFLTVWWAEARVDKTRTSPLPAVAELPLLVSGQGGLAVGRGYRDLVGSRYGRGVDYVQSVGDFLLLLTGQSSELVARVPLMARQGRRSISPGLASLVNDALDFLPRRRGILFEAFVLAFVHVMVIAAFAVAVSTRLPLVFNALFCAAIFVLGNVWHDLSMALFGTDIHLLPNFENLGLTDALQVGFTEVRPGAWLYGALYGIIYTALVLAAAVALFRRREVA